MTYAGRMILLHRFIKKSQKTPANDLALAKKLGTSRSGLARLLDPKNQSVTLLSLNKVASILGKKLEIRLH